MPLRDQILLIDGPLEGRRFTLDRTPRTSLKLHACVASDGTVLAVENDPVPVGVKYHPVEFPYAPVIALDGQRSRDDQGFLRYYASNRTSGAS